MRLFPVFFAILVIAISVLLAHISCDPKMIERGGALISACCSLYVIYLLAYDLRIEEENNIEHHRQKPDLDEANPVHRTAIKLMASAETRHLRELRENRFNLALLNAVAASLGEIIHGFGSIFYNFALAFF
jgi:hypothetical protein